MMMPLLVCVADYDVYASPSFAAYVVKQVPRGELKRYLVGHFDVYHEMNSEVFEQVAADQTAFLRCCLFSQRSTIRTMSKQKYITFFSDSDEPQLRPLGGKGLNLVRMARAGLPVPNGFVLGTGAYQAFVKENTLAAKIEAAVSGVLPDDAHRLEKTAATIKHFFADCGKETVVQLL